MIGMYKYIKNIINLSICFFFFQGYILSHPNNLSFQHLNTNNGLSQNTILCMMQDSEGYLWIGTRDGLNRFDGYNFTVYRHDPNDSTSIAGNQIESLFEDSQGRIWMGVWKNGIDRFNRAYGSFRHYCADIHNKNCLSGTTINVIYEDSQNNIWAGTSRGLDLYDSLQDNFSKIPYKIIPPQEQEFNELAVFDICEDHSGNLWIGAYSGLHQYHSSKNGFSVYRHIPGDKHSLSATWVHYIFEDSSGKLWVVTRDGMLHHYNNLNDNFIRYKFHGINSIRGIKEGENGLLWFPTNKGLLVFNPFNNNTKTYRHEQYNKKSLPTDNLKCITRDRANTIWIGSWNDGITFYNKTNIKFRHHKKEINRNSLQHNVIRCILEDDNKNLWIGTDHGGLIRFNRKEQHFSQFLPDEKLVPLKSDLIKSLLLDDQGHLLIGTTEGLNLYDLNSNKFGCLEDFNPGMKKLDNNSIEYLYQDKQGDIWIGTSNNIYICNKNEMNSIFSGSGNNYNPVYRILMLKNGITWICSNNGLRTYQKLSGEFFDFVDRDSKYAFLYETKTLTVYEDKKGIIWIGTQGLGFIRYQSKSDIKQYTKKDGLPNDVVHGILEDDNDHLWLSTNKGLSCFDPEQETFRNFDTQDGLQSNQFTYNAVCKTRRGEMVFGGVNGFNIFYPDSIPKNEYVPPVIITGFRLFNKDVIPGDNQVLQKTISQTGEIVLRHNQTVITFEFVSLNFIQPQKNQYAYILEGFDAPEEWNYIQNKRTASYTNLDAGEYVFRVKASNNDGVWNEQGASVKITVLPPYWETLWFRVLIAIFILLVLYLIKSAVKNRERLKNTLRLEKVEAVKMSELNKMKFQFFTNISHEFKTPLTLIIAPLEKMLQKQLSSEEIHQLHTLMLKNAHRLMRLINQLMDFRKIESGVLKLETDLGDLVSFISGIAESFEELAKERNIELHFQAVTEKIMMHFDRDKIEKVMYNILSNAFKFTPDGGKITVTMSLTFHRPGMIANQEPQDKIEKLVEIIVQDTGVGIDKEHLPKIFNRFYQAGDKVTFRHHGTGIGLAMAKDLIELHKGKISVDSTKGKGTSFIVRLPVHLKEEEIVIEKAMDGEEKKDLLKNEQHSKVQETTNDKEIIEKQHKPSMLIIEDNAEMRKLIRGEFKDTYHIIEASDGKEGIQKATDELPKIVISDIMMPGTDGLELCRTLKNNEKTSHIPVILLTALSSDSHQKEGLETGADDYISKPFNLDILRLKVDNILSIREELHSKFSKQITLEPSEVTITPLDHVFLEKAIKYIEDNMSNSEYDTEQFSRDLGYSRVHLYRKIQALTNQTVKEFIKSIRLKRAVQLLVQKQLTVSEICYRVGFKDVSYFRKCFKKEFGKSPTEYIEQTIGK